MNVNVKLCVLQCQAIPDEMILYSAQLGSIQLFYLTKRSQGHEELRCRRGKGNNVHVLPGEIHVDYQVYLQVQDMDGQMYGVNCTFDFIFISRTLYSIPSI